MILKMARVLPLIVLAFILLLPCATPAKTVNGDDELVSELLKEVVGDSDTVKDMKKDLARVINDYEKEKDVKITLGTPIEFSPMGDRFFVVSFRSAITSPSSETAIFSLLYEERKPNELEYSKNYISWVGQTEIEGFSSLSTVSLCALFENMAGVSICEGEREKKVFASEMDELETRLKEQISRTPVKKHSHSADDITDGIIKESLIDAAICRDSELSKAVLSLTQEINKRPLPDVSAKLEVKNESADVEALKAQISELQETVARLSAILEGISREGSDLVFSGMNIYVVNGSGTTDAAPNGLGNLIVGYNESDSKGQIKISGGSHNLIVGKNQTYTSYGGLVVGESNKITAPFATITGGFNNSASGSYSSVSGGQLNTASGDYSTVSGGLTRKAGGNNNWSAGDQTSAK